MFSLGLVKYLAVRGFPGGASGKKSACNAGNPGSTPESGRKIPWRREWLSTPVFLPGEFHGQRSLGGNSPWGHKESDMTEQLTHTLVSQRDLTCHLTRCWDREDKEATSEANLEFHK